VHKKYIYVYIKVGMEDRAPISKSIKTNKIVNNYLINNYTNKSSIFSVKNMYINDASNMKSNSIEENMLTIKIPKWNFEPWIFSNERTNMLPWLMFSPKFKSTWLLQANPLDPNLYTCFLQPWSFLPSLWKWISNDGILLIQDIVKKTQ